MVIKLSYISHLLTQLFAKVVEPTPLPQLKTATRGVHPPPDPTQLTGPDQNQPTHDRPVSPSGRRWVTNPRNRLQWVGWRFLSSKTRLNLLDKRLTKIRRFKLFRLVFGQISLDPTRFMPDLGRSQLELVEISLDLVRSH